MYIRDAMTVVWYDLVLVKYQWHVYSIRKRRLTQSRVHVDWFTVHPCNSGKY